MKVSSTHKIHSGIRSEDEITIFCEFEYQNSNFTAAKYLKDKKVSHRKQTFGTHIRKSITLR